MSQEWFVARRGAASGFVFSGMGLGGVVFPLALSQSLDKIGFAWTMRLWALITLVTVAPVRYTIRPRIPLTRPAPVDQRPAPGRVISSSPFWLRSVAMPAASDRPAQAALEGCERSDRPSGGATHVSEGEEGAVEEEDHPEHHEQRPERRQANLHSCRAHVSHTDAPSSGTRPFDRGEVVLSARASPPASSFERELNLASVRALTPISDTRGGPGQLAAHSGHSTEVAYFVRLLATSCCRLEFLVGFVWWGSDSERTGLG